MWWDNWKNLPKQENMPDVLYLNFLEEFGVDFKEKNRYFEREDSHCSVLLGIKINFYFFWNVLILSGKITNAGKKLFISGG